MDLNNLTRFKQLDPDDMIGHINGLPQQLAAAWKLGSKLPLPRWRGIRQVVVAGMGGSAIGSDLVAAYGEHSLKLAWTTWRDYGLPAWAHGPEMLVICSSHSGNTEETLSAFEAAKATSCRILAVCTGGQLEEAAKKAGYQIKVGRFPFSASGKAKAAGATEGFVKVIFDAKYGEWLGAHFIGANVTEMIAEVVVARKLETTAHEIIKSVHPHPTMSEAIMEAAAAAYDEVIHL